MPKAPHKKNNRFYNHGEEKARHRILNVAQVAWHVLVRRLQAKRPPFLAARLEVAQWVEKPNFEATGGKSAISWLGHSTCLINISGLVVLTDPVAGSLGRLFPRYLPLPVNLEELSRVDVILLSHNHRDHLDIPTLEKLKKFNPLVLVPQGDAHLLREIGFHRVHECAWHDAMTLELNVPYGHEPQKAEIIFLPAIHWSGRGVLDVNRSLWGSWLVRTNDFSVYFAGDSAYGPHFANIAHRYGPPDVVLMPISPEAPRDLMAQTHVGVEESLQAFKDLAATHFFPIHWGTFAFGTDRFLDPIEKLQALWSQKQQGLKKLHVIPAGRVVTLGEL
jgi:L-ascorbate metabolism protein UlaG (beta-lactamase superfamily)